MSVARSFSLFLVLGSLGVARAASVSNESATVFVAVSVLPVQYFVDRIAGEGSPIQSAAIVQPGHSPETYQPTPQQMIRLSKTQIYFRVGVPFEKAWSERIKNLNPQMSVVDLRGPDLLEDDPHIWTSPREAARFSKVIFQELKKAAPDQASVFQRNLDAVLLDLARLDQELGKLFRGISQKEFFVFHPSWGYLARDYHLKQIAIENHGREPHAHDLAETLQKLKKASSKVIFVQEQVSKTLASKIAAQAGAELVSVDPLAYSYLQNLRSVADKIATHLKKVNGD